MSGIDQLDEFAKGGPYIGPKGGKWADPQHKIPWSDPKEKAKRKGGKPSGVEAQTQQIMGMIAGKDATERKREGQAQKRGVEPTESAVQTSTQKALDLMKWGSQGWRHLGEEMQGRLKKMGLVRENEKVPGTFVLNENGKALAGKVKKSERVEELEMFAKGNGAMPSGEPSLGGGEEQGGKLDGKGKTSGSGDSAAGSPIAAPTAKKDKLSEDDEDEKKAMKEHKKPIETAKSFRDTTPQGQREAYALEHAQWVSRLQKGEQDVHVGVAGAPWRHVEEEPLAKAQEWVQNAESRVVYSSGGTDDLAAEMMKSESFYHGGAEPSLRANIALMQSKRCEVCGDAMAKALTACPNCGAGTSSLSVDYVGEGRYVDEE